MTEFTRSGTSVLGSHPGDNPPRPQGLGRIAYSTGGDPCMRRILVTGGCGFIGANFVRLQIETYPDLEITNLDALTYAGNPDNLEGLEAEPRYQFVSGDR